ncbi:MAG TPA: hypothetical protein VGR35_07285 [Tepidisphaeraceae bacterium]|nr:hypothetical protein [Tepidisphaeraceae bacterium]
MRQTEAIVRLYVKLILMLAVTAALQEAIRPAGACAYEASFAARCWLAHRLGDAKGEEALVEEARKQLVMQLKRERAAFQSKTFRLVAAAPGPVVP